MVTREQEITKTTFIQTITSTKKGSSYFFNGRLMQDYDLNETEQLVEFNKCHASGKCQIWKIRLEDLKLPIKYGLYENSYLTHENAHVFIVALS